MLKAKYIRVSTKEQKIDRQNTNEHSTYIDEVSGLIPFNQRTNAKRLINDVKKGKVNYLIVHSIDRLGRDIVDIQKQLNWFVENNVQVFCEDIQMNLLNEDGTVNLITKIIIDLLGSIANLEIQAIRERQSQGIKIAKAKGIYKGRQVGSTMTTKNYLKRHKDVISLLKDGLSVSKVSKLTSKAYVTVKRVNDLLVA